MMWITVVKRIHQAFVCLSNFFFLIKFFSNFADVDWMNPRQNKGDDIDHSEI